jgi:hypothetical protein
MFSLSKDLKRHASEVKRSLANLMFDQSPEGLILPAMGNSLILARGLYEHRVRKPDGSVTPWVCDANLIPTEGLTYLASLLGAGTKLTPWYIALYAGAYSPAAGLTAANFTSTTSEITSGSEGYTEANRVTWSPAAAAAGAIHNTASPAAFTIVTATTLLVNGIGMLSAVAKGATTGTLASATRFAAQRTLNNSDVFEIKYTISLTST